jgi:hypothetical protein
MVMYFLSNLVKDRLMFMFLVNFILAGLVLLAFWTISKSICWREALTQLGVQTLIILIVCVCIKNSSLSDTEIINGRITKKYRDEVSCSHSYSCNCYQSCSTDSQGRQSCQEICQTCYEHSEDYDWVAETNVGRNIEIDRIDRQGEDEPPRWTAIRIGEPASFYHTFKNYIKADPDSLFQQHMSEEETTKFPEYPGKIYDYYRIDRGVGINLENELSELNADIGPTVQANFILVATDESLAYAKSLQRAWAGAKKNDIVAVVGHDSGVIKWVEIVGISYPSFKVKLRNVINDYGKLDAGLLAPVKESIMRDFRRRPMSEFEYLAESYKPTRGEWIFSLILSIVVSVGLGWFFHVNDSYEEKSNYRWRRT